MPEGEEIPEDNPEKYGIVYPYFIPFGADWEELEDIDGNGQPEYIVYYDIDNGFSYEHDVLELLVSEQTGTGRYTYTGIYQVQNG